MIETYLTPDEEYLFQVMLTQWGEHLVKDQLLSDHYDGKVPVKDLGIAIPPAMASILSRCSMMWCRQAVKRVADASVLTGFDFTGGVPAAWRGIVEGNDLIDAYDETLPSQLTHGPSFWTVTAGDQRYGEPAAVIASYDGLHATALYDYRHHRVKCGLTVVDVDPAYPNQPTAVNLYLPNGDILEGTRTRGSWSWSRVSSGVGMCSMVVMRNDPDKSHPFGQSAITPAILSLEDEANRNAQRMAMQSELFTAPTRWVMGAPDEIFENGRWEAYLGNIFALSTDEDTGTTPTTGQYPQGSLQPLIDATRQLANQFAAEASIPIYSLLYTEANPASSEAIEASRHDLVEKVEKVNRLNGKSLHDIALLALSLAEQTPVEALGAREKSVTAQFRSPLHPTLAASADAAQKTAATVPGFAGTPTYWRMLGYSESEIQSINEEIKANLDRTPSASSTSGE